MANVVQWFLPLAVDFSGLLTFLGAVSIWERAIGRPLPVPFPRVLTAGIGSRRASMHPAAIYGAARSRMRTTGSLSAFGTRGHFYDGFWRLWRVFLVCSRSQVLLAPGKVLIGKPLPVSFPRLLIAGIGSMVPCCRSCRLRRPQVHSAPGGSSKMVSGN